MKKSLTLAALFLSQSAFSADLVLAPGKDANINGTQVLCQKPKQVNLTKYLSLDDETFFAIARGGIGACTIENPSVGWLQYDIKINGKFADGESSSSSSSADEVRSKVIVKLKKIISVGACSQ